VDFGISTFEIIELNLEDSYHNHLDDRNVIIRNLIEILSYEYENKLWNQIRQIINYCYLFPYMKLTYSRDLLAS